jgi:outer membrane protein TolC
MRNSNPRTYLLSFLRPCGLALALGLMVQPALAQPKELPPPVELPAPAPLSLADCVQIALEKQPALVAHRASVESAEAALRSLENLKLAAVVARDIPIRRKQAERGVLIIQAGLSQAEWETAYAVARTYLSAVYARAQQRVAEEDVNATQKNRDVIKDLAKSGAKDITESMVDRLDVELGLAKVRLTDAAQGYDLAIAALREAMGVCRDFPLVLAMEKLTVSPLKVDREQAICLALARRGEIIQATAAAEITEMEIEAQETSCLPKMPTFASAVDLHARPIPQGVRDGEYRPDAIGLEMPPLLVGHRSDRVERAAALSARANAVVDKTRNLIILETEDIYLKWRKATSRAEQLPKVRETAVKLYKNNVKDITGGQKITLDDLLTSSRRTTETQLLLNEAIFQQSLALIALERATAGGFCSGLLAKP